jgi:hypothetical protein
VGHFRTFQKLLPKVNNHPVGEKSPNLVTLVATLADSFTMAHRTIPYGTSVTRLGAISPLGLYLSPKIRLNKILATFYPKKFQIFRWEKSVFSESPFRAIFLTKLGDFFDKIGDFFTLRQATLHGKFCTIAGKLIQFKKVLKPHFKLRTFFDMSNEQNPNIFAKIASRHAVVIFLIRFGPRLNAHVTTKI